MAKTFTPASDVDFDLWLANYKAALATHYAAVGLASTDVDAVEAEKLTWDEKFSANNAARLAWRQAAAAKSAARDAMETLIAPQVARIQSFPGTTDELRQAFGLKPKAASTSGAELPAGDTPIAKIDINARQKHELKIYTMTPTGPKRAKPVGALGCEIRRKIGDAPGGVEDMELVGIATKSSFTIEYPMTQVGKVAHYMMRWVMRNGQTGDWSETESATIAA